jgi:hypothetical protein
MKLDCGQNSATPAMALSTSVTTPFTESDMHERTLSITLCSWLLQRCLQAGRYSHSDFSYLEITKRVKYR